MTLIKWQKESPARTILHTADLFNEFFNDFAGSDFRKSSVPAVNVAEHEGAYQLHMAAPGWKKEDFKIALEENTLMVSAEGETDKSEKFTRREFSRSSFSRRFSLPENVDQAGITARYENGIMIITLPKRVDAKPATREISIV